MSAISTILTRLRAAIWAKDVRDDIANAIEQCYSDVSNPTLKTEALEAALQTKIDEGEMAALTIGDHTITAAKLAQGVIDNTLATSGAAADAKKTGDEIAAVKADLGDQVGIFNRIKGYYINLQTDPVVLTPVSSSSGLAYSIIECAEGDVFVINATGGYGASRAWAFIDSSGNRLSVADMNTPAENLELTAPTGAVKLIINDKGGGISYKVGNNLATNLGDVWDKLGIKTDDIITPSNYLSKLPSILNIDVGKDIAIFGLRYDVTKDMITDLPADYSPTSSALIVFPSGTTNRNYQMYLLCTNAGVLFTGIKSGNSLIWKAYKSNDLYRSGGISMYKRIGVFGDSFSCGSIYDSNGTVLGRHEELSWIANLARRNGCEYRIYGFGGATTKSWLSNETYGKGLYDASTDHCGLYFLAFGINDSGNASYLGTINDIASKADSFYGNYGKIINLILSKEPKARLIMLGCGRSGNRYAPFTNAIKAIANYFNIPYYDQFMDYYVASDAYIDQQYSGHPTAHGYASLSRAIERMYSYVCDRNAEYFKSYAGEDYT